MSFNVCSQFVVDVQAFGALSVKVSQAQIRPFDPKQSGPNPTLAFRPQFANQPRTIRVQCPDLTWTFKFQCVNLTRTIKTQCASLT